jgi:hypothetical protein
MIDKSIGMRQPHKATYPRSSSPASLGHDVETESQYDVHECRVIMFIW